MWTALLPKPQGGHRPIGLFRAIYRLWARARRPLVDAWAQAYAKDGVFSMAPSRQATDAVWRAQVRAAATRGTHTHPRTQLGYSKMLRACPETQTHQGSDTNWIPSPTTADVARQLRVAQTATRVSRTGHRPHICHQRHCGRLRICMLRSHCIHVCGHPGGAAHGAHSVRPCGRHHTSRHAGQPPTLRARFSTEFSQACSGV